MGLKEQEELITVILSIFGWLLSSFSSILISSLWVWSMLILLFITFDRCSTEEVKYSCITCTLHITAKENGVLCWIYDYSICFPWWICVCQQVREKIEYENLAKLYLREVIKKECWDDMAVKGRSILVSMHSLWPTC